MPPTRQKNPARRKKPLPRRQTAPDGPRIRVDYDTDDASYHGHGTALSETGIFIATHESFTIGQEIMLTLGAGSEGKNLMIEGIVADRTSEGIHVRFNNATDRQLKLIRKLNETVPTDDRSSDPL
jgi:Tfp pilus assembly protein PilZ